MKTTQLLVASLLLASCVGWCADGRDVITLYVGPDGNDGWSGRRAAATSDGQDGPLATLEAAKTTVRTLKALSLPIRVMVRGGTYFTPDPIVFKPEDSGTKGNPVVYQAYPGETPVFSAGCTVSNWTVRPGGLWVSFLPREYRELWPFGQVWVDGKRRELKPEPPGFKRLGLAGARAFEAVEPGQWYLDHASSNLYYRPLHGECPCCLTVTFPVTQSLVLFRGDEQAGKLVEYVELDGLSFAYTERPGAGKRIDQVAVPAVVHGTNARNCAVRNCTMTHVGSSAVWFEPVPGTNVVTNNTVCDPPR